MRVTPITAIAGSNGGYCVFCKNGFCNVKVLDVVDFVPQLVMKRQSL